MALRACNVSTTISSERPVLGDFGGHQRFRDNPDDLAAGGERGAGGDSHQADAAAAIDERDAAFGTEPADRVGERCLCRIMAGAGAAEQQERGDHAAAYGRMPVTASPP